MHTKKPEVIVFAGPNGSGKSSVTRIARIAGEYINADEIKKELRCSDIEAAEKAQACRQNAMNEGRDFTFETVLSTHGKIDFLNEVKAAGYFIRCIYVLTCDPNINVYRVISRMESGGHGVPADKVISRYQRCLTLIPELYCLADTFYLYDNSDELERIAVKKRGKLAICPNVRWSRTDVETVLGIMRRQNIE